MNESDLNKRLSRLYENFIVDFEKVFDQQEKRDLSLPLLMSVFPDYFEANYKILFIGKETFYWYGKMSESSKLKVNWLLDRYNEFEFARDYRGRNSPFWRFLHGFYNTINPECPRNGFLWTNFSKVDFKSTTPGKQLQFKAIKGYRLLKDEIRIVQPQIVIFLTGWKYDKKLRETFNGIDFEILEPRSLSKLKHLELPEFSFRTYHPNYLNRSGQFDNIINKITSHILSTQSIQKCNAD